jgi:hypothetical protein
MASTRQSRYAVGGVATSSTGIIFVAVANHDWNTALGAAGTVAPALVVFLIGNGGVKGVLRRIWSGLPFTGSATTPPARRRRASRTRADQVAQA